jgi:hypothetical protein
VNNSTKHPLRKVQASDFLTESEASRVQELWQEHRGKPSFAAKVVYDVLAPISPRINAKLGLECDLWDLAYALEYGLFKRQPKHGGARERPVKGHRNT